jgi:hypothetical protein
MSPYMAKITGNEDFLYVWTLGVEGMGDGSDTLVTLDVRGKSKTFGNVIHTVSVGGRHEAHPEDDLNALFRPRQILKNWKQFKPEILTYS